jgi:hypothetical protein
MIKLYVGLVHGPVKNKNGLEITTSVTNMDIHDISRSARTFGAKRYFLITPIVLQKQLVDRILGHWGEDHASDYNPDRAEALSFAKVAESIEKAVNEITELEGERPKIVVTGANFEKYDGDAAELIQETLIDNKPIFLLFGTGWGLTASVVESANFRLKPIFGLATDGYNHLSVRSAVAIYLDRIARSL